MRGAELDVVSVLEVLGDETCAAAAVEERVAVLGKLCDGFGALLRDIKAPSSSRSLGH